MYKFSFISILILVFLVFATSCNEKEISEVISDEKANISSIEFEYNGSIYNTQISENKIILDRFFALWSNKINYKEFEFGRKL
jgi:uncharacterized lipoprotein YehR (DUF1307 family)